MKQILILIIVTLVSIIGIGLMRNEDCTADGTNFKCVLNSIVTFMPFCIIGAVYAEHEDNKDKQTADFNNFK